MSLSLSLSLSLISLPPSREAFLYSPPPPPPLCLPPWFALRLRSLLFHHLVLFHGEVEYVCVCVRVCRMKEDGQAAMFQSFGTRKWAQYTIRKRKRDLKAWLSKCWTISSVTTKLRKMSFLLKKEQFLLSPMLFWAGLDGLRWWKQRWEEKEVEKDEMRFLSHGDLQMWQQHPLSLHLFFFLTSSTFSHQHNNNNKKSPPFWRRLCLKTFFLLLSCPFRDSLCHLSDQNFPLTSVCVCSTQ